MNGESIKLVLRTKDEAVMGEVGPGTNSSSAGGKEVFGSIEDDTRGCEYIILIKVNREYLRA